MSLDSGGDIESRNDYTPPEGEYRYYLDELNAAKKRTEKWRKTGDKIDQRFKGKSGGSESGETFKLNLFHSNVTTLASMLYGNTPKIDVARTFSDSSDDAARVAAETMERLLNLDIQENGRETDVCLKTALQDRLLQGLGCARVRYTVETEPQTVFLPDGSSKDVEMMKSEDAPIDYYYWGDVLWSWARNWNEVHWIGFKNMLNKDEIAQRFGADAAENVELSTQKTGASDTPPPGEENRGAWKKAEIWEIWDKQKRKVVWLCMGYEKLLDEKPDPLGLKGFYPCPPFLMANTTSTLYLPTPDFVLSQDLYNEIDLLQTRISILTEAVKVVGVYDASAKDIQRMFDEGFDNQLIPVENWALFGEKNGIRGQIDWVPIADVVNALDKLRELRTETIGLLQQVTGMSDIMRGELGSAYEGVGQSEMKARFGSIRVQALQDEFAAFATDLMQIKAEIITKHFSPETIVKRSNMAKSPDVALLPQALQLIKNPEESVVRVSIRPESVAMVDYAQLKRERTEYINALAVFLQSAAPLMETEPNAKPFLLELLQWGLAGFKGSNEIEGVIDRAIEASQQEAQQPKPDPEQVRLQGQMQLEKAKLDGELAKINAKMQADLAVREADKNADIQTSVAEHQASLRETQAELQATLAEIKAKLEADVLQERLQSAINAQQALATSQAEMVKDTARAEMDIEKEAAKTEMKIAEVEAQARAKMQAHEDSEEGESDG